MPKSWIAMLAVAAAGAFAFGGVAEVSAQAPAGCPGNLLQNANFDGPSRKTETEGTSLSSAVSNGWNPWLIRGDQTNNREPEYKVEQVEFGGDPSRTRSGGRSMKWFTTWGTHTAGIYQRVPVRPGSTLEFSIYSMLYSGEADGWSDEKQTFLSDSVQPGNYRAWVGIDPTGAVPAGVGAAPPDSVVWAPATMKADEWARLATQIKATGPAVTVYTKGQPEWAVKHNDSWWDDACLRVVGAAPVKAVARPVVKPVAKPVVKPAATAAVKKP